MGRFFKKLRQKTNSARSPLFHIKLKLKSDNYFTIGDDDWKYKNLLPYFKKLENYEGEFPNGTTFLKNKRFFLSFAIIFGTFFFSLCPKEKNHGSEIQIENYETYSQNVTEY